MRTVSVAEWAALKARAARAYQHSGSPSIHAARSLPSIHPTTVAGAADGIGAYFRVSALPPVASEQDLWH